MERAMWVQTTTEEEKMKWAVRKEGGHWKAFSPRGRWVIRFKSWRAAIRWVLFY